MATTTFVHSKKSDGFTQMFAYIKTYHIQYKYASYGLGYGISCLTILDLNMFEFLPIPL